MDKRGAAISEQVSFLWRLPLVILVVGFIAAVTIVYLKEDFQTNNVEDFLLSTTLRYSPNCLALEKEKRVEVNTLDLKKFEGLHLASCYRKKGLAYRVTLVSLTGTEIVSASLIPVNVEKLVPVCSSVQSLKCSRKEDYVLYQNGEGKTSPAILRLEVVRGAI